MLNITVTTPELRPARISSLRVLIVYAVSSMLAQAAVVLTLNGTGVSSLKYNGTEFISNGDLQVDRVLFANGTNLYYGDSAPSISADPAQQVITRTYPWGSIQMAYAVVANRLNLTITTVNRSASAIVGIAYEPITLKFPSAVQQYDGNTPLLLSNLDGPTVIPMTFSTGVMVFANDDPSLPLMAGFPWALDKPTDTVFPLRLTTGSDNLYPTFFPTINRPIPPGKSDQYTLSLRFGAPGSTALSLASDVYQKFAAFYPPKVNWTDRRAIGYLILATSAAGWVTNPRGWFLDPTINVTTPAGIAAFHTRVLQYADDSIAILKSMNAQGMITWDIEGEQYPQPTTYIGDPRIFGQLAPEMAGVADAYFQKFRDAGLRVGVCIRPQQLVINPDGSASQQSVANPAQELIAKITYAKNRWGVTLFYVDSNGGPDSPMDPSIFREVAEEFPDVLLIPEHGSFLYYAYTAPYENLSGGSLGAPNEVRAVYPQAFNVIDPTNGPIAQQFADLVTAVSERNILLFRGWYNDPINSDVKAIYACSRTHLAHEVYAGLREAPPRVSTASRPCVSYSHDSLAEPAPDIW